VFLASVAELKDNEISVLKKLYPNFKVVHGPTVIDWMERSGVNQVPYMIRLDKDSIVRRLTIP